MSVQMWAARLRPFPAELGSHAVLPECYTGKATQGKATRTEDQSRECGYTPSGQCKATVAKASRAIRLGEEAGEVELGLGQKGHANGEGLGCRDQQRQGREEEGAARPPAAAGTSLLDFGCGGM